MEKTRYACFSDSDSRESAELRNPKLVRGEALKDSIREEEEGSVCSNVKRCQQQERCCKDHKRRNLTTIG